MPTTGQNAPAKTAVMPKMLKPDAVASARAAANVETVTPGFVLGFSLGRRPASST